MNRSIHIEYPSTLPDALHQTPAEFEREARLAMAVNTRNSSSNNLPVTLVSHF